MRKYKSIIIAILLLITWSNFFANQNRLDCNIYVADIDDDGTDDFLKIFDGTSIQAFKSDFNLTPITDEPLDFNGHYVSQLVIGNFNGDGNIILLYLTNGEMRFYRLNKYSRSFTLLSTQSDISFGRSFYAGNFDGDPGDEILAYSYLRGSMSFYEYINNRLVKVPNTRIRLSDLPDINLSFKQILVGEFNGNNDSDDLLIVDTANQVIYSYFGVFRRGVNEFKLHSTIENEFITDENDIITAKINDDLTDDVVIRGSRTGHYFFYNIKGFSSILNVENGQLPIETGGAIIVKHDQKGSARDNILYMRDNWITLTGAATNEGKATFWWAYRSDYLCNFSTPGVKMVQPQPITNLCPSQHVAGDLEFDGNGPEVFGTVSLSISADRKRIEANIDFTAVETKSDWSEVRGQWVETVYTAPLNLKIESIEAEVSNFRRTLSLDGGTEIAGINADGGKSGLVQGGGIDSGVLSRIIMIGDTGGNDISTDSDCNNDTRILSLDFNPIEIRLSKN